MDSFMYDDDRELPQHLLRKGRNVLKFYDVRARQSTGGSFTNALELKSPEQFAKETNSDVRSSKKFFKYSKLEDLVYASPFREHATLSERLYEQERRQAFLHFLRGLLAADPTARWTAREALTHSFITGDRFLLDVAPLNSQTGDCASVYAGSDPDASSSYYHYYDQQQPPYQVPSYYAGGVPTAATHYQHYQQQLQLVPPLPLPLVQHERVCPIGAYYSDVSYPYYGGEATSAYAYAYALPWVPVYAPAVYAPEMGADGSYETAYQSPYEFQSHEQPQYYSQGTFFEVRVHDLALAGMTHSPLVAKGLLRRSALVL